jgi:hypothetical protein
MRLRLFAAALLAPLVLGSCDRNPLTPAAGLLLGRWASDPTEFQYGAPNGSADVVSTDNWDFRDDGTFEKFRSITDLATGRQWVLSALAGTWSARRHELRLVYLERFSAKDVSEAAEVPAFVPDGPYVSMATFERRKSTLVIRETCGYCVGEPPSLHQVVVEE